MEPKDDSFSEYRFRHQYFGRHPRIRRAHSEVCRKGRVRVPPSQFGHEAMKSSLHTLQEDSHHLLVLLSRKLRWKGCFMLASLPEDVSRCFLRRWCASLWPLSSGCFAHDGCKSQEGLSQAAMKGILSHHLAYLESLCACY